MTIRKRILLTVITASAIVIPVAAQADPASEAWEQVQDEWPEEAPTPWYCHWVGPHSVCIPPD